ncbi:MAG: hypothetical protein ACTS3F_11995 [Phycisphaerales bacterium]
MSSRNPVLQLLSLRHRRWQESIPVAEAINEIDRILGQIDEEDLGPLCKGYDCALHILMLSHPHAESSAPACDAKIRELLRRWSAVRPLDVELQMYSAYFNDLHNPMPGSAFAHYITAFFIDKQYPTYLLSIMCGAQFLSESALQVAEGQLRNQMTPCDDEDRFESLHSHRPMLERATGWTNDRSGYLDQQRLVISWYALDREEQQLLTASRIIQEREGTR